MLAEQRVVLEEEAVSGIWIEDELGVGQALRQAYRVHGRDDQVMAPARHQDRVQNFSEPRVGGVLALIPAGQGRALRLDPRSREKRIMLACPRLQPDSFRLVQRRAGAARFWRKAPTPPQGSSD